MLVTDRTPYKHYMDLPISLWRRKEMMIAIIFEYGSFLHSVCCILLYRVIQGFDLVNFWGKIGGTEGKMNLTEFVEIDLDGYA